MSAGVGVGPAAPSTAPRPRWTVRRRLLVLMVGLMALGLALTGVLSFALQHRSLSERVQDELQQEVDEVAALASAGPARDAVPFTDVDQLLFTFINTAVSGEDEALLAIVDGEPRYRSGGDQDRLFEVAHPDILAAVEALDVPVGRAVSTSLDSQGTELRMIVADVHLAGDTRDAAFVVVNDIGRQRAEINRQVLSYAGSSLAVLAVAGLLAYAVLGRLLRPLTALQDATAQISSEDLSRRVDVASAEDTDVAQLAVRFNEMLERLEEGMNQQRQFLDDAAHELRTPLTILRGNAELLRPDDPEEVAATRVLMLDEVDRMQRLVDDLLVLARSQRPDFVRVAPTDVTELAVECMERVTALGDRRWKLAADAEGELRVDRQRIIQAVVQLAANAVKFSEDGSAVEITSRWVASRYDGQDEDASDELASGEVARAVQAGVEAAPRYLALSVADQGLGIPEDHLSRIFDRFARAENAAQREGSGLGLAIVSAIAHAHGGAVGVESVEGVGTRFTLWLPDRRETAEPTA